MKPFGVLVLCIIGGHAQATIHVTCHLKTRVVDIAPQPFAQTIGRVNILEVWPADQNPDMMSCTQQFKVNQSLWVDLSHQDMKIAHAYTSNQIAYFKFTYEEDASLRRSFRYTLESQSEYFQR